MGVEVLEEIIDFEIRPIIKALNELPFLQTIASCSGWSSEDGVSEGPDDISRIWIGKPYVSMLTLDDVEMLNFIKFIMSKMIFDYGYAKAYELETSYLADLSKVALTNDSRQLIHFVLEYRKERLLYMMFLYEFDRDQMFLEKTWSLFHALVLEYTELFKNQNII